MRKGESVVKEEVVAESNANLQSYAGTVVPDGTVDRLSRAESVASISSQR